MRNQLLKALRKLMASKFEKSGIENEARPLGTGSRTGIFSRVLSLLMLAAISIGAIGCANPAWEKTSRLLDAYDRDLAYLSPSERYQKMTTEMGITNEVADQTSTNLVSQSQKSGYRPTQTPGTSSNFQVRAQSPDNVGIGYGNPNPGQNSNVAGVGSGNRNSNNEQAARNIPSSVSGAGGVQQTTYQYPEITAQGGGVSPSFGLNSPNIGSPNEMNSIVQPFERGGNASSVPYSNGANYNGVDQNAQFTQNLQLPPNFADIDVYVTETQTGRINFGGAYNSDNGIVGQFIIDEKNFDITKFPRSLRDFSDGTAFRGAGQTFRLELVPGANVQRYLVSFAEPYMLGTDYSFSASAYYFDRQYFDWDENRLGGRIAIGRRLTQDLSISAGLRMENVDIDNERLGTSPQLNDALGSSNLFLANVGLIRDTRDHPFLATEGSYLSATYSQAFGDYSYARGDIDYRRYRLMYERPDGSGRHTVSFGTKLGFSGSSTPVFENYFAGGFSTLRGFDFRGAAPTEGGVRVGGEFQWLNSLEYMFPLTADDMIKGVVFCDFGTVEQNIELNKENFRVAPGFGLRIHMPAAGIGAPLAFDFAFPVSTAAGDEEKVFSFYLGVLR
jgi:outer membrane protein insertion porin family